MNDEINVLFKGIKKFLLAMAFLFCAIVIGAFIAGKLL